LSALGDSDVAAVLGVEPPREEPVALLAIGRSERAQGPVRLEPIADTSPALSPREHRFAEAEQAQAASSLATADEVRRWREAAQGLGGPGGVGSQPDRLEEVVLRRGSARDFTTEPIGSDELAAVQDWACAPVPGDLPPLCSAFVVAHALEGLEPGAYRFEPPGRFEPVGGPVSRRETARICLEQPLGGNAAATLFFTADLDRLLAVLGGRGYRAAQLDAGIRAGRTSLGAYARGLGATGLTFYDDEVSRYLGTEEEPMMCVAVGIDANRPSLRGLRR
jgi:hypothetical protein